jgi:1-deoxy-D-xylulose-5-phosphate synthase
MKNLEGPQLLHIRTMKGKGFLPAEKDPVGYHAVNKIEAKPKGPQPSNMPSQPRRPKYQAVFGRWLCDMAEQDTRLIGITPAMCEGSGMVEFAERFSERYLPLPSNTRLPSPQGWPATEPNLSLRSTQHFCKEPMIN